MSLTYDDIGYDEPGSEKERLPEPRIRWKAGILYKDKPAPKKQAKSSSVPGPRNRWKANVLCKNTPTQNQQAKTGIMLQNKWAEKKFDLKDKLTKRIEKHLSALAAPRHLAHAEKVFSRLQKAKGKLQKVMAALAKEETKAMMQEDDNIESDVSSSF